ncbi:type II toxin-antitoxin system VapC family toxin [Lacibacterium aquatile]|uniref:Type II toxin-antitoxin system VapC family toxin n=1 Tax=Lacibacterium aquatile TaxID=1168082 RepID=A0ABW5DWL5_9PROT
MAEAMIVAGQRNLGAPLLALIEETGVEVVPVTGGSAARIAEIYARWGKGNHPARLNLGDCFAYDVAKQHNCPLLYVGEDFAQTDIVGAL